MNYKSFCECVDDILIISLYASQKEMKKKHDDHSILFNSKYLMETEKVPEGKVWQYLRSQSVNFPRRESVTQG